MISKTLREKLNVPEYRKAFVGAQINIGLPFQIRALLKSRIGWTQATLAERTGMLQPRISSLMTPGKTRPNIETLRRVAEAFDCGLMVQFVSFSELANRSESFNLDSFNVPAFEEDKGFFIQTPAASTAGLTIQDILDATETGVVNAGAVDSTDFDSSSQEMSTVEYLSSDVANVVEYVNAN